MSHSHPPADRAPSHHKPASSHDHDHDHGHDQGHDRSDNHGHDHSDNHNHDHAHDHQAELRQTPGKRLAIALGLTAGFMFVEVVGGWLTHSLALLSDAMHMLTDCAALTLALLAQRLAAKPRTIERSYGFRRAETIAALLNAVFLCATSVWIAVEAVRRWSAPVPVLGRGMLLIATLGLVVNLLSAWALSTGGHGQNVNTRAAMAHVLSDALGSVAAIAAAAAIVWFGWQRADSLASLGVSVLILWGAWRLLLEATDVLMQSAPRKLNLEKLRATIGETPGVCSIHELHVWQVAEGFSVLTVHVVVDAAFDGVRVTSDVAARVRSAHKITQVTVQPELAVADDVGCVSEVSIATVASSVGASTAALAKG